MASIVDDLLAESAALEKAADKLRERAKKLKGIAKALRKEGEPQPYISGAGKMTDAGVRQINGMFARGERVNDIARHLKLSPSAVSYRLKKWREAEAARKG